jgi:hypothetical protein
MNANKQQQELKEKKVTDEQHRTEKLRSKKVLSNEKRGKRI